MHHGKVSFQHMMQAITSLLFGSLGLGIAFADMVDVRSALQAAKYIFDNIDAGKASLIDGLSQTGRRPPTAAKGDVELKNVTFRYPTRPDAEVCRNYSLTIQSGEVVALVGPSGGGKSTLMNLLLRFYDPSDGQLKLDSLGLRQYNVRWLRSQIGYVGQEPVLFTGSVASNIAKGKAAVESPVISFEEAVDRKGGYNVIPVEFSTYMGWSVNSVALQNRGYSAVKGSELADEALSEIVPVDEEVMEAAKASSAHDFIMTFPEKYDTDVGQVSVMVSGGQKQRIAIARALIKKPAVLLLDEATSALDAASERLVQESIDKLQNSRARTTVIIAHRLSTIRNADRIVVIDKGAVVELGTHDELIAKGNLYFDLWNKQVGKRVKP